MLYACPACGKEFEFEKFRKRESWRFDSFCCPGCQVDLLTIQKPWVDLMTSWIYTCLVLLVMFPIWRVDHLISIVLMIAAAYLSTAPRFMERFVLQSSSRFQCFLSQLIYSSFYVGGFLCCEMTGRVWPCVAIVLTGLALFTIGWIRERGRARRKVYGTKPEWL